MHLRICAALLLMSPAAFAQSVDLKTQLQSCQQISGEEQRLNCFDQIVSQLDSSTTATIAAPATTATPATAAKIAAETSSSAAVVTNAPQIAAAQPQNLAKTFGLKAPRPDAEIEEISSAVKTVSQDLRKKLLVTLENGQQWRQIDQEYLNIQVGDRCVVKRGAIGSFLLGIEGTKKKIRVKRVE